MNGIMGITSLLLETPMPEKQSELIHIIDKSAKSLLKVLNDNGDIHRPYGRNSVGILIFQDLAVIPILLMITILSDSTVSLPNMLLNTLISAIVVGVVLGLVVGKPIGIVGLTYLAQKLKIVKKPDDLGWDEIIAVGFLGGIGFTMSIFITQLAFLDQSVIDAVKLGIFFASFIAGVIGVVLILKAYNRKLSLNKNI